MCLPCMFWTLYIYIYKYTRTHADTHIYLVFLQLYTEKQDPPPLTHLPIFPTLKSSICFHLPVILSPDIPSLWYVCIAANRLFIMFWISFLSPESPMNLFNRPLSEQMEFSEKKRYTTFYILKISDNINVLFFLASSHQWQRRPRFWGWRLNSGGTYIPIYLIGVYAIHKNFLLILLIWPWPAL